jgi:TRAP-type C4-dicarboxylate transport system permease small subunit
MKKVLLWIWDNLEIVVLMCSMVAITVVMFLQVFSRYVMGAAFSWTEELARYLLFLLVATGFSAHAKNGTHLRIDIWDTLFPKTRPYFNLLADVTLIIAFVYLMFPGLSAISFIFGTGQLTAAMQIPLWVIFMPMYITLFLTVIRVLERNVRLLIGLIKKGKVSKEEVESL